jgi:hypothetical protein
VILYIVTLWPVVGKPTLKAYGRKQSASSAYAYQSKYVPNYYKRVTLDEVHVSAKDFKRLKESGERELL